MGGGVRRRVPPLYCSISVHPLWCTQPSLRLRGSSRERTSTSDADDLVLVIQAASALEYHSWRTTLDALCKENSPGPASRSKKG